MWKKPKNLLYVWEAIYQIPPAKYAANCVRSKHSSIPISRFNSTLLPCKDAPDAMHTV